MLDNLSEEEIKYCASLTVYTDKVLKELKRRLTSYIAFIDHELETRKS